MQCMIKPDETDDFHHCKQARKKPGGVGGGCYTPQSCIQSENLGQSENLTPFGKS